MASLMTSDDWTLVAVLGVPHCLYAFIWFFPSTFMACCLGAEPVATFYKLAASLKGTSFCFLAPPRSGHTLPPTALEA